MTDADLIRDADLAAYREYASRPGDGSHPDGFSPARCALEHAFFSGIAHARVSAEAERAICQSGPAYEWRERFKRLVDEMLRWSNLAAYNGEALDRARTAVEAEHHKAVAEMVDAKDRAVEWEARALAAEQMADALADEVERQVLRGDAAEAERDRLRKALEKIVQRDWKGDPLKRMERPLYDGAFAAIARAAIARPTATKGE